MRNMAIKKAAAIKAFGIVNFTSFMLLAAGIDSFQHLPVPLAVMAVNMLAMYAAVKHGEKGEEKEAYRIREGEDMTISEFMISDDGNRIIRDKTIVTITDTKGKPFARGNWFEDQILVCADMEIANIHYLPDKDRIFFAVREAC
ncbi:MAG: hypothetical protein Q4B22_06710 [Eubacteriales bacterium]|nr:hypothetical protein [Eubacteriales bacterium]